ncbi:MAG: hypothetical protein ABGZ49_00815 [Akkermansiaceae bacterium]
MAGALLAERLIQLPPEPLRRLIDAAVIPEVERTRWIELVANTPYQER